MTWIKGNRYLSLSEMQNNATIIKDHLLSKMWSLNAICGVLGNMQAESTINPGIWQNLNEGNTSGGFGLVQWTPSTNFTNWADSKGYAWDDGYAQLEWILSQTVPTGQWIGVVYPTRFLAFQVSTETPETLATAFLKNFERAGVEVEEQRRKNARYWYNFFLGIPDTPSEPETPSKNPKKKKFNFILFNKQRRYFV